MFQVSQLILLLPTLLSFLPLLTLPGNTLPFNIPGIQPKTSLSFQKLRQITKAPVWASILFLKDGVTLSLSPFWMVMLFVIITNFLSSWEFLTQSLSILVILDVWNLSSMDRLMSRMFLRSNKSKNLTKKLLWWTLLQANFVRINSNQKSILWGFYSAAYMTIKNLITSLF